MATYDDFDGVFFTIQSLRMFHDICSTNEIEFIVVDNNPTGTHAPLVKKFVENNVKGKYIPFSDKKSTATRNEVFKHATGEYTVCLDCHVLVEKGGIDALLDYYKKNPDTKDLVQGPLLYDNLKTYSTHFQPVWRSHMYGIWGTDKENYEKGEPFEIPMMGLGLFSCKTSNWLGFNPKFKGFGGEEGYIHEKFRQAGGKCICIPQLKWVHRFGRPNSVPYPLHIYDRIWNYIIGAMELYKDPEHPFVISIKEHFQKDVPEKLLNSYIDIAKLNA